MMRPTQAIIDLNALQANCRLARSLAPDSNIMAVVKGDAYGHGAIEVSRALSGVADMLAVTCIEEALVLREAGITQSILLLEGCFSLQEYTDAAEYDFELVIHSEWQVEQLLACEVKHRFAIWLKIDSGMHRLGFDPEKVEAVYNMLNQAEQVRMVTLVSHFASADDKDIAHTSNQIQCFRNSTAKLTHLPISLANSAAIMAWPETHASWNRPGIMLYGLSPFTRTQPIAEKLIPVMTLASKVIAVHELETGAMVGYGNTWTAQRPSRVATIAIGYGDGYPRTAKSGTPVLINGQRGKLAGRVSMDMISVDVTDLDPVESGDEAILWGKDLNANEVGEWSGTIGYELVTRMPSRVPRRYK